MTLLHRLGALALPLFLVLAGCGGDGDGAGSATSTTAAEAPPSTGPSEEDRAVASPIVYQAGDFPEGWNPEPTDNTFRDEELDRELFACLAIKYRLPAAVTSFSQAGAATTLSEVMVLDSADTARSYVEAFKSDKAPECLTPAIRNLFQKEAPPGGLVGPAPVEANTAFPPLGEASAAYRISTVLRANQQELNLFIDYAVIQRGRLLALLFFSNAEEPFPPDLAPALAAKVADRMPAS